MTLSTTTPRISFAGDGSTTSFAFGFKIWAASDLKVYLRDTATLTDTLQALSTHYNVSGTLPGSGAVNFLSAPPNTARVLIVRDPLASQELDLQANGSFAAENIEVALDKVVGLVQSLDEQVSRTLSLPVGTSLSGLTLPEPTLATAGQVLTVNPAGDGYRLTSQTNIATTAVSSYIATLVDDADAPAARTTLGIAAIRQTGITYDPASLTSGSETESGNITVTGAALGDHVMVFPPYDLQGIICQGRVTAAGTVRIRLRNGTAGTVDLSSSSAWEVWVVKAGRGSRRRSKEKGAPKRPEVSTSEYADRCRMPAAPARLFIAQLDVLDVAPVAVQIDVARAFARIDARAHADVLMPAVVEVDVEVVDPYRLAIHAELDLAIARVTRHENRVALHAVGNNALAEQVPSSGRRSVGDSTQKHQGACKKKLRFHFVSPDLAASTPRTFNAIDNRALHLNRK